MGETRMKTALLLLIMVLIPVTQSSATSFTLTPGAALWFDTGITVGAADTVTFTGAVATWSFAGGVPALGSGGSLLVGGGPDEWITNQQHGELIGFIGNPALNLNAVPRVIAQNDLGLFVIGGSSTAGVVGPAVTETGRSGELWLGFNDDFASLGVGDNSGTGSVDVNGVSTVPEPSTLLLVATSLAGVGALARRRRK
jgi:hypothetical protein